MNQRAAVIIDFITKHSYIMSLCDLDFQPKTGKVTQKTESYENHVQNRTDSEMFSLRRDFY